ncbi:glycosyltransferase family 39 protein [Candidatus Gottesmanbacteria bacterium]|nr:glycosyltransferase family 39 protein [Candidatus Gottesmanbacteria bacterium]
MEKIVKKHWEIFVLAVILIVAAYLRLYHISGYMTFLGDEGRDVLVVKRIIVDHKFTLLGPTASVGGFFLGPIYYYFMAPFLWLWRMDPTGPAVMVALFGIATVFVVYNLGKELFGTFAAIAAAALYATSPLVIAYSRSSWNPNLVPFFATLLFYLLYRTVAHNQWRLLFVIGLVFGIGLQLHYLFAFLFVATGIWFFLFGREKKYLPYYALAVAGFIVGYAPFLLFEVRHGFPNTRSVIQFLLVGKETGFTPFGTIETIRDVSFRLFGRLVFRLPQPETWKTMPNWQQGLWWIVIRGSLVAVVIGLYKGIRRGRQQAQQASWLLLLWLVTVVFLFGLYRRGIYDYYFGIAFALPFLLVGGILSSLARRKLSGVLAVSLFVGILWFNWQGRPFIYGPNNQLAQARNIAKVAYEKAGGKPFNFALVAPLNSDHAYRYFFEIWGNAPVTIENVANDPQRRTVTDQLIIICEEVNCQPLGHPLWEIAGFGRAEIAGKWQVPFVTIYRLTHYHSSAP